MRVGTKIFSSVNTKSIVFGAVIIFACVAFIFTGFGSLHLSGIGSMNPSLAATVDSLHIEMNEFINYLNRQQQSQPEQQNQRFLTAQIIKRLVDEKILANEAHKIGFTVSDNQIANAIKSIPAFQDPKTNQFSLSLFKNYLKNQNIQEIDFYNYIRNHLDVENMDNLLNLPVVISDDIVKYQYDMINTEFNLEYAVVSLPEQLYQKKVQSAAETYANDLVNLKQLQDMYVQEKDKYNQNAKTKVRTILISYKTADRVQGDGLNRSKDDALLLAQSLLSKIQSGKKFSILAAQINDDLLAKKNNGDIGFIDESTIDTKSIEAIKKLNSKNLISNIVDTSFGFRIFEYLENHPAIKQDFEDVKVELAKEVVVKNIKMQEENSFQNKLLETLAAKNITQINALLTENQLSWKYLSKPYKISDSEIVELGSTLHLAEYIFTLKNTGDTIAKILPFDDKKVIIKLVSINKLTAPTEIDIKNLKNEMIHEQTELFHFNFKKFIHEKYENEGKIKINPMITQ